MRHPFRMFSLVVVAMAIRSGSASADEPQAGKEAAQPAVPAINQAEGEKLYLEKVQPLLEENCWGCHGEDEQESSLRLDSFSAMSHGGVSGPVVVPGKPNESMLMGAIRYKDDALQMPPDGKLPDDAIATLQRWIEMGAPHPAEAPGLVDPRAVRSGVDLQAASQFWAFQPPQRPEIPTLLNAQGKPLKLENPIDALVLAKIQEHGLVPAPPADKRTLIRRATLDLTGLPPTPAEVGAFLADDSPQAFSRVIDRLLDSPQYGERWGRHWLDIARYADSNGLDENVAFGNAWRYRDYVIASFNKDKPYDRFLLEQLAGDLLSNEPETRIERLTATGFLSLGGKVLAERDKVKMRVDIIDEQVTNLGQALLGLTIGCARCHDHKFDPILTADYYALAGILESTKSMDEGKSLGVWHEIDIATPAEKAAHEQAQAQADAAAKQIKEFLAQTNAQLFTQIGVDPPKDAELSYPPTLQAKLADLQSQADRLKQAVPELPHIMGVEEGTVTDVRIHVRGSHLTLGRVVPRGAPAVLSMEVSMKEPAADQSGRLQFARWLTNPQHPLTARVMVNRLWRWHFGEALVPTPDNFGKLGQKPTNQPLLDWLALEFIEQGWSVKQMHRLIMLSQTYQMSSQINPANAAIDPDNQFHSRANIWRMEAEAIRDSLLSVGGLLDLQIGGSLLQVRNREYFFNHTSKDATSYDVNRRSVYLPIVRNNLYDGFSLFDYTDASVGNGDRDSSVIAPQALFLLNSKLLLEVSDALAQRLLTESAGEPSVRIRKLYELAFSREATPAEVSRLMQFIESTQQDLEASRGAGEVSPELAAWSLACQAVLLSNEFIYVE